MTTPTRWALPAILSAQLVIPLSIAGTAVALPRIASDLGSSPGPLQWVVNGFNVAFALCTLLWGGLADRAGHHRVFRAGVVTVLFASIGSALAPTLVLLDVARLVAGAGAASVLTSATSILSLAWEGAARARAFALFGTINGLGLALGPTLCGLVTQAFGWRAAFWLPAIVLAASLVASRGIPAVQVDHNGARRLLDVSLLTNRRFAAMTLVPITASVGFVTFLTYLPAAFSAIHGWSAGQAGVMMLVATLPVILSPSATVSVMKRHQIGIGPVLAASIGCLLAGSVAMLALDPGMPVWAVAPALVLIGLGFGLPLGVVDGEALARVPGHSSGSAAGLLNFARIGSEALAVACYSALLTVLVRRRLPDQTIANQVAAGAPGRAADYASAQHMVALGCGAVVLALGVAIWALSRGASNADRSKS